MKIRLFAATLAGVAVVGAGVLARPQTAPRVIHVPGHTPGSAALFVAARSALFVGDALATYVVTTGERGPRIAPFTADRDQALASLTRLEELLTDAWRCQAPAIRWQESSAE